MVGMTVTALDLHSALQKLFAPYTYANGAAIQVTVTQRFPLGMFIEINTTLKPFDLPKEPTDRQVREALLESANRAIDAVEAFGFRHWEAPRIDFTGQVAHRFDQEPMLITECGLRLHLQPPKTGAAGASWTA